MPYHIGYLPSHVFSSATLSLPEALTKMLNEAEQNGADTIQPIATPIGDYLVIAHFPPEKDEKNVKETKDNKAPISFQNTKGNGPADGGPRKGGGKSRSNPKPTNTT